MLNVIILTAQQADQVRGPSAEAPNMAALAPVGLTDGRFILGVEVLSDPAHAQHWAFLATLAQADVSAVASLMSAV
jgi:hypothetical protein